MIEIMAQSLVVIPGWTGKKSTYKRLLATAPAGITIKFLEFDMLLTRGKFASVNQKILTNLESDGKTDLLGISLGGTLAIDFASQYPQKVKRLFLIDSCGIPNTQQPLRLLFSWCKTYITKSPSKTVRVFNGLIEYFRHPITQTRLAQYALAANVQSKAELLNIPTQILWGKSDYLVPVWQANTLHKLIKNSTLTLLPQRNHDWILYEPEKFWEAYQRSKK